VSTTTAPPGSGGSAGGTGPGYPRPAASPPPAHPNHRVRFLVVLAILAGAVAFLLVEGLGSSLDYFETVHQALSQRATLGTRTFRLEGLVVPGSIQRTTVGADFTLSDGRQRIPVVNTGTPPELFQPDIPVVVDGHFTGTDTTVFFSNQIEVKHSSTYIAEYPGRVRAPNGTVR
jgi:cytochrome c-type biogenesis protein CcmE